MRGAVAGGQGQRLKLQEDKETENVLLQARRPDEAAREAKATTASGQTRTEEKEDYEAKVKAARDKGMLEAFDKISKKKKDKAAEEERLAPRLAQHPH